MFWARPRYLLFLLKKPAVLAKKLLYSRTPGPCPQHAGARSDQAEPAGHPRLSQVKGQQIRRALPLSPQGGVSGRMIGPSWNHSTPPSACLNWRATSITPTRLPGPTLRPQSPSPSPSTSPVGRIWERSGRVDKAGLLGLARAGIAGRRKAAVAQSDSVLRAFSLGAGQPIRVPETRPVCPYRERTQTRRAAPRVTPTLGPMMVPSPQVGKKDSWCSCRSATPGPSATATIAPWSRSSELLKKAPKTSSRNSSLAPIICILTATITRSLTAVCRLLLADFAFYKPCTSSSRHLQKLLHWAAPHPREGHQRPT